MTPAQAAGFPNFVTDVPVQGPTDPDMRAAACFYTENMLPKHPECVDCEGTVPMWTKQNFVSPRHYPGLSGEQISLGGHGALGFAIGDSEVWTKLTQQQQTWIIQSLTHLNNLIYQNTGTTCPDWGNAPTITGPAKCFQSWFNANKIDPVTLRTDGVFDQSTLDALLTVARIDPGQFPTPYPGDPIQATAEEEKKGLSKGAMYGIAAGGALVVGGTIWAITRKKSKRS